VTEESLCWQEGLEEWRPIRSIPDLAALVREAAQGGNRGSYVGQPPTGPDPTLAMQRSPAMASAAPMKPPAPARASITPAAPARPSFTPAAPAARSNVVPLRPAASSAGDDMMGLGSPMAPTAMGPGNTSAALAPSLTPAPAQPMFSLDNAPSAVNVPVADPFAVPPAPATAPLQAPYRDSFAPPAMAPTFDPSHPSIHPAQMPAQQRGVPLWFWPILVVALGFGGGVAFLVFRPQPTPAPVVIQMPQAPTATATATEQAPAPVIELAPTPSNEPKKTGPVARGPAPKAPEEKKGIDLSGLGGGTGGPNVSPNSGGGPSAGGGGLDSAGVERTVRNHSAGVKRTCWERGGADQKSSVNITVTANVAPNGSVASTSSSGDDPVVAKCIENQVRTWQFPPPGSSTTINIPFKFVRQ
jgi:hypothetical protein